MMKFLADTILKQIKENLPLAEEEIMIKINGFAEPKIYRVLAQRIKNWCAENDISCNIKFAGKKYAEFSQNPDFKSELDILVQENCVANEQSITYYRNLHDTKLLVLLGTETEDDKDGLLNCAEITSESLARNLRGNYAQIFTYSLGDIFSSEDETVINKLYKDLFDYIPCDICKLSSLADEWNDISNIDEFIDYFYTNLPFWNLPFRKLDIRTPNEILSLKNKNCLKIEHDVISHEFFNDISLNEFNKFLEKCAEYEKPSSPEDDVGKYAQSDFDWSTQGVKNYQEYVKVLTDFIGSTNIDENRKILMKCDISIAEDILNIKIKKEKSEKPKDITLFESPIKVFTQILLASLAKARKENTSFCKLQIALKKVSLVTGHSESESVDSEEVLKEAWRNFCVHTNGIIEFLQNGRDWQIDGNSISIECIPSNVFNPLDFDAGLIENASSVKKNSVIEMEVFLLDENGNKVERKSEKYKWNFTDSDFWLNEFSDLAASEILDTENCYIPLNQFADIKNLISAGSGEEFFDLFSKIGISFSKEENICDFVCQKLNNQDDDEIKAAFIELGEKFIEFAKNLHEQGYYKQLLSTNSAMFDFIQLYNKLGKILTNQILPENRKWLYDSFIHAFCIEQTLESVKQGNEADCCIVPPWNPIALEKLNDQKLFFLDGCKEWWKNQGNSCDVKKISHQIELLEEMSVVKNAAVLFPAGQQKFFGAVNSFGSYSLYAADDFEDEKRIKDSIQKDLIFDDSFTKEELVGISEDSKMIFNIMKSYAKTFIHTKNNLRLSFINPGDFQPVISAVHTYVKLLEAENDSEKISIELYLLIKPENKGGKNYLAYWLNEFFGGDENISVKMYVNEWSNTTELDSLLETNNDIIFYMNFLKTNDFSFSPSEQKKSDLDSCKFPIVYKPKLVSHTADIKRSVELSQPQFIAESFHTQAVYCRKEENRTDFVIAAQEMKFDSESAQIVREFHQKSNWVCCMDSGLDGALLKNESVENSDDYSIIGFSTGNGNYGKYNVTITARKAILKIIEESFKIRLSRLFHWEQKIIDAAVSKCMKEASCLDGISLLSAINLKDNNINEFMAYVLTSFKEKQKTKSSPLKVLIHLDSFKHWFNDEIIEKLDDSASRTDFLLLEVCNYESEKLLLNANVVECKIAKIEKSDGHKEKALRQVNHSLNRLKEIFNPNSKSVLRRYWYAQLYRALAFAQVSFSDNTSEYEKVSEKLRLLLDGKFEIQWTGEIDGYWIDMDGESERVEKELCDDGCTEILIRNIPQLQMQKMFIDDSSYNVSFVKDFDENLLRTKEEKEEYNREQEEETENTPISLPLQDIVSENLHEPKLQPQENINPLPNTALEQTRVLIGKEKNGQNVYWEFGNPQLANRHLLITGTSGQGKTYCIQAMLYELTKSNVSSVVFDYTEGFRRDQLNETFNEKIGNKFRERIVKIEKVPVNPFKIFEQDIAGIKLPETSVDVANRLKSIFSHVYKFGDQQESAIYEAVKNGVDKYGEQMNMDLFIKELGKVNNKAVPSVISKIKPFSDAVLFDTEAGFDWGQIVYPKDSQCFVFQLTAYDRDTQVIITELLLWNLWYYASKIGKKDNPFVVILDEAQNLSHKEGSPSAKILTEGRKFGWSAWFATQSLQVLNDDEVTRLLQSAFKLYFKPTDVEITKMAKQLDPQDSNRYLGTLKSLNKGECIVVGNRCNSSGAFASTRPTVTKVTALEER